MSIEQPQQSLRASHIITGTEAGQRCDRVIAIIAKVSRSVVAEAFARESIRRNGLPVKASTPVESGDVVEFELFLPQALDVHPQDIPLHVLFEDEEILVVDKPAGMVTHPARGTRDGTLSNALAAHVATLPGDPLRPGLVHRLDRDTSGLLLIAKTERALRSLGKAMERRDICREYLGLVAGIPEHERGTLDGPIGRDPHHPLRFTIRSDGKPAITHYEVRERLERACELRFRLETGRTHQIRVHLNAFGHPILGDPVYGRRDSRVDLPGQALHAWRLAFRHPLSSQALEFEREPPEAYLRTRENLRSQ
ncbi:MAG TPA: RluA family pseudouridine synthase [Candidatus Baltobacteraceae bacterium]|jgi:23S rRNA pseudouridine1911/1915/1917 synthase|nr:RluA family pseudouridine synthase [Candidatus Baltobacteraceae bacterium]